MPELPEVESARVVIDRAALARRIVDVDDSDTFVCRPHPPGQLRDALLGSTLTAVHRIGKTMWCDTAAATGRRSPGPTLGIHLGMSGKIVIADRDGSEVDGGDYWEGRRDPGDFRWSRFSLTFADGGGLHLVDPRRLGRVRLDPVLEALGPDAATITPKRFRAALAGRRAINGSVSSAPVKARLLDQHVLAGVGNLLADEILWRARVHPARPVRDLTDDELDRLARATRSAVRAALRGGGVHTLPLLRHRKEGAACPRDGGPMRHGTVGGRTSWWCEREQVL